MRDKRACQSGVIIILILLPVIALLVLFKPDAVDYKAKDMVVQSLNNGEGILIKDARSGDEIDYFFLETGKEISSIIDDIEWKLCEEDIKEIQEISYPYMDIRIAEGYDVVIAYTGVIYVQDIYSSQMMGGIQKYISTLNFSYLEEYIRNNSLEYHEEKVTNETFAY